ncbi:hypothetical protein ABFS83_07G062500 [Erythranthe nasuta]
MDTHRAYSLTLLFIFSVLSIHPKVIFGDSTVVFLDSPTRQYLRHPSSEIGSLSPSEIGATASVLLGSLPPSTLSAAGSAKLNEVLMPKPFDKPRAVFVLEVTGAEDSQLISDSEKSAFSRALTIKVDGNQRVDIQWTDEDSLVLNEVSSDAECSDSELNDFASELGGSYVEDASGPLNGELVIPMGNSAFLRLHLSERADREFITGLVSLINNIKKAKKIHEVLAINEHSPAMLISGRFDGIKALEDRYGKEGITQRGLELFVNCISKAFDSLLAAYEGQLVGVIAHVGSESKNIFDVTATSRPSARSMAETEEASAEFTKIAEIVFVRTALAWVTGIIFLIATYLAIYFLMYMPITKDTLLYSNVKLD